MKKLIAVALAMLMLLASVAYAENVAATVLSDPQLSMTQGGQTMNLNLEGLELDICCGMAGGVPTINYDLYNGEDPLFGAVMQITQGRVLLDVDGVEGTYYVAMPDQIAGTMQQAYDMMFGNVEKLNDVQVPMIPGVTIPKLDIVTALGFILTDAGVVDGAQTYTFNLPYSMINQLLVTVAQSIKMYVGDNPAVSQLSDAIDQLQQADSGVTIQGQVSDTGSQVDLAADFYLVQGGQAAPDPVGALLFSSTENMLLIEADAYQDGASQTLGTVTLTSEPESATLQLAADIMGQFTFDLTIFQADGMQMINADLSAQGQTMQLAFSYGKDSSGMDVTMFNASAEGVEIGMSEATETLETGEKVGTLSGYGEANGSAFEAAADLSRFVTEAELRGVTDAANAINLETMTEEEQAQLAQAVQDALGGLRDYLNTLEVQNAA